MRVSVCVRVRSFVGVRGVWCAVGRVCGAATHSVAQDHLVGVGRDAPSFPIERASSPPSRRE